MENGYSYVDYATQATLTADTYIVTVPRGTEKVTLSFPENRLAYNYTKDGEYLGGYYPGDTYMTGALTAEVPLDYGSDATPADGEIDYIQVQTPYDAAWNSVLLFTVTFRFEEAEQPILEAVPGSDVHGEYLLDSGDGSFDAGLTLYNESAEARTVNVLLATYDADGRMIDLQMETVEVAAGGSRDQTLSTEAAGADTFSLLVLDESFGILTESKKLSTADFPG